MPENTIVVGSDDFKKFMRCVNLVKESCNDLDIKEGKIRQRSNDRASLFEIDLSGVINDLSFPLTNLKQKSKLIEYFTDDVTITLNGDERKIIFSDKYSSISFDNPDDSFVDNPFISAEEFATMFLLLPEDLLLECDIPRVVVDRIRITVQQLNLYRVELIFNGETASILTVSQAKDNVAKFVDNITTNQAIECKTSMMPVPFIIDTDNDMKVCIYRDIADERKVYHKFEMYVDDVNVLLYARSALRNLDEE